MLQLGECGQYELNPDKRGVGSDDRARSLFQKTEPATRLSPRTSDTVSVHIRDISNTNNNGTNGRFDNIAPHIKLCPNPQSANHEGDDSCSTTGMQSAKAYTVISVKRNKLNENTEKFPCMFLTPLTVETSY
uniref:Uncharacterized protein n=1 Tax=Anopheles dirus TaxID=7168 RepID=A0A182NYY8_9DIPT